MASLAMIKTEEFSTFADKATADAMVAKAKELRPLLMEQAKDGEMQRSPTKLVEKALFDNKILYALLPKRLGGVGLSLTDFCRMQIEIAKGDPAISWVVQIINGTSWVTSLAPDSVQDIVFANGPTTVCGAYNPRARPARSMVAGSSTGPGHIPPAHASRSGPSRVSCSKDMKAPSSPGSACATFPSRTSRSRTAGMSPACRAPGRTPASPPMSSSPTPRWC